MSSCLKILPLIFLCLLQILAEVDAQGSSQRQCTMPFQELGGKIFYFGTYFEATWFEAKKFCRSHGLHLASISSEEENDALEEYIKNTKYYKDDFWIGGTDAAANGGYVWISTRRPITFSNWSPDEPNHSKIYGEVEHCLEIRYKNGEGLMWNDRRCSLKSYFICEVTND